MCLINVIIYLNQVMLSTLEVKLNSQLNTGAK